jgi:hypothetical protein
MYLCFLVATAEAAETELNGLIFELLPSAEEAE